MLTLRHYQQSAIDATYAWLQENDGNPLIVLPTGTGKSLVIADICKTALDYPDARIIVATHSQELVEQNYLEFMDLMPFAPAGIYAAGLKRREKHARILFCSIQSAYKKGFQIGKSDLLLIDEAHTISRKGQSMWGQFIKDQRTINPEMRVIGLTATPFRLDSGNLVGGDGALFHDISYEYPILDAIREGYLAEVVPKSMATKLDTEGVGHRGGEFIASQLNKAVNIDAITKAALDEVELYGHDRRSWLIFACGVDHAHAIHEELQARGYKGAVITGNTDKNERRESLSSFKNYEFRYLVNNLVLTTGFNHKGVDLIADLNPTESAGLHVQKVGRGTRTEPNKTNCLLLDFAQNVSRHGPIDQIRGKDYKEKDGFGVPPMKDCPKCTTIMFAGLRVCPSCFYKFPEPKLDIKALSDNLAVFSNQEVLEEWKVDSVYYSVHRNPNKPLPTMKVTYMCGLQAFYEWVCFEHEGFARRKAESWFRERSPYPDFVPLKDVEQMTEMISNQRNFKEPSKIWVKKNGKFWEIKDYEFKDYPDDSRSFSSPESQDQYHHAELDDFEIPF